MTTKRGGLRGSIRNIGVGVSAIPDSAMFQSPLYQYTAVSGLSVSDGQTADNWTEQLAEAGDATTVGDPIYRSEKAGFEAVEYDGTDDGHDFPNDGQLPTGTGPVSIAMTVYPKSLSGLQCLFGYGDANTNESLQFVFDDTSVRLGLFNTSSGRAVGGTASTGSWLTVGGVIGDSDTEVYLNGSSEDTDTDGSPDLVGSNRGIGYRANSNDLYADVYIYDLIICDARESDQAFSDYHTNRLG